MHDMGLQRKEGLGKPRKKALNASSSMFQSLQALIKKPNIAMPCHCPVIRLSQERSVGMTRTILEAEVLNLRKRACKTP
jgi:hypothetical protein